MTWPLAKAEPKHRGQMDTLAAILLRDSQCGDRTLKRARRVWAKTQQRLDTELVQMGLVSERCLACACGTLLGLLIARPEHYALDEPLMLERLQLVFHACAVPGAFVSRIKIMAARLCGTPTSTGWPHRAGGARTTC